MPVAMKLEIAKQIHTARFRVWTGDKLKKWVVTNHYESWFWTILASHSYSTTMVFIHVYQIQSERYCNVFLVYHISNHGHEIKSIVMTSLDCERFFAIASYVEYEIRCIDVHLLIIPAVLGVPGTDRGIIRLHQVTAAVRFDTQFQFWCVILRSPWHSISIVLYYPRNRILIRWR